MKRKPPKFEEQLYSFALETVLFFSELEWETRNLVEARTVKLAESKKCIPVSVAKKALQQIEREQRKTN